MMQCTSAAKHRKCKRGRKQRAKVRRQSSSRTSWGKTKDRRWEGGEFSKSLQLPQISVHTCAWEMQGKHNKFSQINQRGRPMRAPLPRNPAKTSEKTAATCADLAPVMLLRQLPVRSYKLQCCSRSFNVAKIGLNKSRLRISSQSSLTYAKMPAVVETSVQFY